MSGSSRFDGSSTSNLVWNTGFSSSTFYWYSCFFKMRSNAGAVQGIITFTDDTFTQAINVASDNVTLNFNDVFSDTQIGTIALNKWYFVAVAVNKSAGTAVAYFRDLHAAKLTTTSLSVNTNLVTSKMRIGISENQYFNGCVAGVILGKVPGAKALPGRADFERQSRQIDPIFRDGRLVNGWRLGREGLNGIRSGSKWVLTSGGGTITYEEGPPVPQGRVIVARAFLTDVPKVMAASPATFTLTGVDATLLAPQHGALSGAFDKELSPYAWFDSLKIPAEWFDDTTGARWFVVSGAGAFTETGIASNLLVGHRLAADVGTFSETGTNTFFHIGKTMAAAVATFTETGNAANLLVGHQLATTVGTFTETGNTSNLLVGRKLTADVGTFTLTGNAVTFPHGTSMAAAVGTFTETGNAAGLTVQRRLTAAVGTFTLTGNDANLLVGHKLSTSVGPFTLTGNAVTFASGRGLVAGTGAFTLTGNAATFLRGIRFVVDVGTFTETGNAANLLVGHRLATSVGVFTETGNAVTFLRGKGMVASAGAFTLTGVAAGLRAARLLGASVGTFTETGNVANLLIGRRLATTVGTFTYTRNNATLVFGRGIIAIPAAFTLTGNSVAFPRTRIFAVDPGVFVFTGRPAGMLQSAPALPNYLFLSTTLDDLTKNVISTVDSADAIEATLDGLTLYVTTEIRI